MIDHQKERLVGEIIYYNHQKKFGFIKTSDGDSFFFYSNSQIRWDEKQEGLIQKMFTPFVGDTVSFLIRPSEYKKGELEAYGLKWIGNSHKEALLLEMKSNLNIFGEILPGFESVYYLKPENHKCWLKIIPGPWDVELPSFLEDREGSWMNFRIVQKANLQRMKAILLESPKSSIYDYLSYHQKAGFPIPLRIISNKKGKIKVETEEGGIKGFFISSSITDSGELLWLKTLSKDMVVDGFVSHVLLTSKTILVDFFKPHNPFNQEVEEGFSDAEGIIDF